MERATTDRGEIVHFAGFHHLSPGLDARGAPALSTAPGDGVSRCGWERFFHALDERRLAVAYDAADAASVRFVPATGAHAHGEHGGGLGGAIAHARRFWAAWRGRPSP